MKSVYNVSMQKKIMSRKISPASVIIASVCILLYLAALVSAAVRIYTSIDQRRDTAIQEFESIADLAATAGVLGFMDEPFIRTIEDALVSSETLEAIIITGPYGEYAFEKTRGQAVNWVNNSPRFKSRFDLSDQPLRMSLRIENLRNVNIEGKAGALDYERLSVILKHTLFLVLTALALAFFTLLMEALLGKPSGKLGEDTQADEEPPFAEESAPEEIALSSGEDMDTGRDIPRGLYTPEGNIGWEEYTKDRLESELQRCASNEQDLVFLAMEFKNLNLQTESFYSRFAEDAVNFFILRDLIFKRGEQGISVIFPNVDLETAFAKSQEFHDRCLSNYSEVLKAKTDLCIGLSSRSGRLISAERLSFEAGEALQKALADPDSHIVAFKSDPEKFRAFIASQNK